MLSHAEDLIAESQGGKDLSAKERRHCVNYLIRAQPELTNVDMANMFRVSEMTIRNDIKKIREDKASKLKEDDVSLVIADIVMNFERQVRDIEMSKRKARVGSKDYLEHCKSIFNLEAQKIKILQDLGFYPKNLGVMTVDNYSFQAHIVEGKIISGAVDDPHMLAIDQPVGFLEEAKEDIIDAEVVTEEEYLEELRLKEEERQKAEEERLREAQLRNEEMERKLQPETKDGI